MLASRFVLPFKEMADEWVEKLSAVSEILEQWTAVQAMWQYLEAVFTSGDIAKQLPQEAKRFMTIDKNWEKLMAKAFETRNVVQYCFGNDALKNLLPHLLEQLEVCQKALSGYLDQKRAAFPRFYFVSDAVRDRPRLLNRLFRVASSRASFPEPVPTPCSCTPPCSHLSHPCALRLNSRGRRAPIFEMLSQGSNPGDPAALHRCAREVIEFDRHEPAKADPLGASSLNPVKAGNIEDRLDRCSSTSRTTSTCVVRGAARLRGMALADHAQVPRAGLAHRHPVQVDDRLEDALFRSKARRG